MNDPLPPPLDGGCLAQTLVEYRGMAAGGFTIRGQATRRHYCFAQSPAGRRQWVYSQDLERFRLLADFEVHDEHAIDPEGDERRATKERMDELELRLAEQQQTTSVRARVPRQGRPRVPDELAAAAWHLHHHCGWRWYAVAEHQGKGGDSPEVAVRLTASRWALRHPVLATSAACSACAAGDCPPVPE